jgi:argininosuccinate lyase
LRIKSDVSEKGLKTFVAATELANMLVRKYHIPFRSAHKIIGALVKTLIESKRTFKEATPEVIQKIAKETVGIKLTVKEADIDESVDLKKIVENYSVTGGPAPATVKKALATRKKHMVQAKSNVSELKKRLDEAKKQLESTAKSISEGNIPENGRFKNSKR